MNILEYRDGMFGHSGCFTEFIVKKRDFAVFILYDRTVI